MVNLGSILGYVIGSPQVATRSINLTHGIYQEKMGLKFTLRRLKVDYHNLQVAISESLKITERLYIQHKYDCVDG